MNTLALIFLILALIILFGPIIYCSIIKDWEPSMISVFSIVFFFAFGIHQWPNPQDSDVQDGKAQYVETQHIEIINNDTVKYTTYKLQWLPEWKYGRKQ